MKQTSTGRSAFRLACSIIAASTVMLASAQEVGMRAGGPSAQPAAAIASPLVASGRVTFNLRATEAKAVTVSGDFGPDVALSRGADGVWTTTVGPLKPDEYVYYFTVDGVRLPDPVNPQVKIGYVNSTTTSIVNVPGDTPAFFDVQDVAHGEIRTLLYKSKSNNVVRELNVYLPPGYDANPRLRYPVLYLLHGFANDHHSWHRYGRANDILDNLLATKSIRPFIVVMPLGYGGASVNGDGTGIPPANAGAFGGDFALYERDILEDVIPLIDGKYRTLANHDNRAIIGFSMGGMQAGRFGLGHLDTFSYVGIMSAGLLGNPASAAAGPDPIAAMAANPAAANKQIKLLWIACGVSDTAMAGARTTHEALQKAGIKHTFVESEGAHHWRVWRGYLRDVAPLLFR
ncbi:MAG: alpha/beta hydrolase-fold protein [Pseudomonadota bacterium]